MSKTDLSTFLLPTSSPTTKAELDLALKQEMELISDEIIGHYNALLFGFTNGKMSDDLLIKYCCTKAKDLVVRGADINLRTNKQYTLIHIATLLGDLELQQFALERKADISALDPEGQTLLHMAVINGGLFNILTVLNAIKSDATVENNFVSRQNIHGDTALHYAALRNKNSNIARMLISDGVDSELLNKGKQSPLDLAMIHNPNVAEIIKSCATPATGKDNIESDFGRLGIFFAVKMAMKSTNPTDVETMSGFSTKVINKLVKLAQEGTDSDKEKIMDQSLKFLYITIDRAAKPQVSSQDYDQYLQNMEEIMAMVVRVVDAGANVNLRTIQNYTALHFASYLKLQKIVDDLVARDADCNAVDEYGVTPAYYGIVETIGKASTITLPKLSAPQKTIPAKKVEKQEVLEVPIVEKTPAERLQELQKLMSDLQRSAKLSTKVNKESEVGTMLWLIEKSGSDANITTSENWSALHLAARFGRANNVENLMQKNADVNAVTANGLSVARCAINGGNNEVVKAVLGSDQLRFSAITDLLKEEIESKNKPLISLILGEEKVITKFANLSEKERNSTEGELRVALNKISKHAIFKNTKESLEKFCSAAATHIPTQNPVQNSAPVETISKAERERRRKAENKIKAEQEEKKQFEGWIKSEIFGIVEAIVKISEDRKIAAVKQAEQEEAQKIAAEIKMMLGEDHSVALAPLSRSADEQAVTEQEESQKIAAEIKMMLEEDHSVALAPVIATYEPEEQSVALTNPSNSPMPTSSLSPHAPEFVPASIITKQTPEQRLKSEQEEMKSFLQGSRQIDSVFNLPLFLQPSILDLLKNGSQVQVKGSVAYQASNSNRLPSDLDLEIFVGGIGKWPDQEIQKLVQEKFNLEITPEQIYRKNNVFTLNVKDEARSLDLSFYDPTMLPPRHLSWTTSREGKIFFSSEGVANSAPIEPQLFINPEAHGLVKRLCFLETVGVVNRNEIVAECCRNQINLAYLLFKELKLDNLELIKEAGGENSLIKESLTKFAESHHFDRVQQKRFLANLSWISGLFVVGEIAPRSDLNYKKMFVVLDEMEKAAPLQTGPASTVNAGLGVSLAGGQVAVTTK